KIGVASNPNRQSRPVISGSEGSEGSEGHQGFEHDRPCGEVKDGKDVAPGARGVGRTSPTDEAHTVTTERNAWTEPAIGNHRAIAPDPNRPRLQRHARN